MNVVLAGRDSFDGLVDGEVFGSVAFSFQIVFRDDNNLFKDRALVGRSFGTVLLENPR